MAAPMINMHARVKIGWGMVALANQQSNTEFMGICVCPVLADSGRLLPTQSRHSINRFIYPHGINSDIRNIE